MQTEKHSVPRPRPNARGKLHSSPYTEENEVDTAAQYEGFPKQRYLPTAGVKVDQAENELIQAQVAHRIEHEPGCVELQPVTVENAVDNEVKPRENKNRHHKKTCRNPRSLRSLNHNRKIAVTATNQSGSSSIVTSDQT